MNVNIRGLIIFSQAPCLSCDDRIGRVPSLRECLPINANYSKWYWEYEIVRGPAWALYGPNAADGVFAIRTKSPLDQEDKYDHVFMTMGVRSQDDGFIDAQGISFTPTNTLFTYAV